MAKVNIPRRVADIMTRKVFALTEDDRLQNAERHMVELRFRHLPVVRGTKLVGLITHRDLMRISSTPFSTQKEVRDYLIRWLPAREVMQTEVATVGPDSDIAEAGELMWDMKIGCLCVTDDDDNLLGIVTEADYLKLAVRLVRELGST